MQMPLIFRIIYIYEKLILGYVFQIMACGIVASPDFLELRLLFGTYGRRIRTACAEIAPRGRVERTGHVTLKNDSFAFAVNAGIRYRNCRNERTCVRVHVMECQFITVGHFNDFAEIHNADTVADMFNNR